MVSLQLKHLASEALGSFKEELRASPFSDEILELRMREACYWLSKSLKFVAPTNGQFLERLDLLQTTPGFPHLPHEAICLEYDFQLWTLNHPHGIALTDEQPDVECVLAFYPNYSLPIGRLVRHSYGRTSSGEFVVWPLAGFYAGRRLFNTTFDRTVWSLTDPILVIPKARTSWWSVMRRGAPIIYTQRKTKRLIVHALTSEAIVHRHAALSGRALNTASIAKDIAYNAANAAIAVAQLSCLLECHNVAVDFVKPSSAVDEERQAAGKPPLFSYGVLRVGEAVKWYPSNDQEDSADAKALSPRYGFGHIRRIDRHRKAWVPPGEHSQADDPGR